MAGSPENGVIRSRKRIDAAGALRPDGPRARRQELWVVADPASNVGAVDLLTDATQRRWVDEPALNHLDQARVVAS